MDSYKVCDYVVSLKGARIMIPNSMQLQLTWYEGSRRIWLGLNSSGSIETLEGTVKDIDTFIVCLQFLKFVHTRDITVKGWNDENR